MNLMTDMEVITIIQLKTIITITINKLRVKPIRVNTTNIHQTNLNKAIITINIINIGNSIQNHMLMSKGKFRRNSQKKININLWFNYKYMQIRLLKICCILLLSSDRNDNNALATSSYYNDYYNGDYDYYDSTSLQPSEFETRMTKFVRYIAKGNNIDYMEVSLLII